MAQLETQIAGMPDVAQNEMYKNCKRWNFHFGPTEVTALAPRLSNKDILKCGQMKCT